jgi:hypothetical protein
MPHDILKTTRESAIGVKKSGAFPFGSTPRNRLVLVIFTKMQQQLDDLIGRIHVGWLQV